MEDAKIAVHIGLQKTGSTFLQHNVWPFFAGYVDRYSYSRNDLLDLMGEKLRTQPSGPLLLSHEDLSGTALPREPGQSWALFEEFCCIAEVFEPKPTIILIVRPHDEWLWSCYLHYRKAARFSGKYKDYVERFSDLDLSWSRRLERLAQFPLLAFTHKELRERCHDVLSVFSGWHTGCPLPEGAQHRIRNPVTTHPSPKSRSALWVSRQMYRTYRPFWRRSRRITQAILGRDILPDPSFIKHTLVPAVDRWLPIRRLHRPPLPEKRADALARDWQRACELLEEHRARLQARVPWRMKEL